MSAIAPPAPAIRVAGLTVTAPGRTGAILGPVDLEIPPRSRILLTGPSGAGKTTLLHALGGLLDPESLEIAGTVTTPTEEYGAAPADDYVVASSGEPEGAGAGAGAGAAHADAPSPSRGIAGGSPAGLLQQEPIHAIVAATAGRDTAFGPENRALPREAIQTAVTQAEDAARFPLPSSHGATELSGGQMQRLALAGLLATDPGMLLLDEPVSMLDEPTARRIRAAVDEAAHGRTLVVVDHHPEPWRTILRTVVVLSPEGTIERVEDIDAYLARRAGRRVERPSRPSPIAPPPTTRATGEPARETRETRAARAAGAAPSTDPIPPRDPAPALEPTPGPEPAPGNAPGRRTGGHDDEPDQMVVGLTGVDVAHPGRDQDATVLLNGVNLEARAGTVTALAGPSGVGKSTLLRVLAGLDRPLSGRVRIPDSSRVAWVPQNPEHYLVATTVEGELLASPLVPAGDFGRQLASDLVRRFGLGDLLDSHPMTLSGGEKRRVAIAAALAQRPDALLLDEPTVGLDDDYGGAVLEAVSEAARAGVAVIVSSHDEAVLGLSDQVLDLTALATSAPAEGAEHDPARGADRTIRSTTTRHPAAAETWNPLTLLLIAVAGVVGSLFTSSVPAGLAAMAPIALLVPLCSRRLRPVLLRMIPVAIAALSLVWTTLLMGNGFTSPEVWTEAVRQGLRITTFVAPGVIASAAMDPTRLGDALAQRTPLPERPVVASVAGLIRLGHLGAQWRILADVRSLRGLGPRRSPVSRARYLGSMMFAMVLYALRSAEVVSRAMDSRGFATARKRTYACPSPFTRADIWGALVAVLIVIVPLTASRVLP